MKKIRWITAIILATAMLFVTSLQSFASVKSEYVSDIRIGYGDEGKSALENEGYTVWQNLNANEGGNGSAVWLGYKTTENPDEAITDIALMNMKGGYSFDAYTQEIADLNRRVSEQLTFFKDAIIEFRNNYNNGNSFAIAAYNLMNGYTEDDTLDTNGKPIGIGDVFLNESTPDETLHRIFLEGNTEALSAIEQSLAMACIEIGDDNVLSRIEETEYPETLNPNNKIARTTLLNVFDDFHSMAVSLQSFMDKIEEAGGLTAYLSDRDYTEEEIAVFALNLSYYTLLSEVMFGDTGMSLLDFALLDDEIENEDGEVLEDEYLEMLAVAMTKGQLGIVSNVGIMKILYNALSGNSSVDFNLEIKDIVSVYTGVDRSLFEDIDSIALTSSALRDKAAAEGNNFGKDTSTDNDLLTAVTAVAGAVTMAGLITIGVGMKTTAAIYAQTTLGQFEAELTMYLGHAPSQAFLEQQALYSGFTPYTTACAGGLITTAIGLICVIVAVVVLIFCILQWIEKPIIPNTEYTQIPRVIVEKPDGQKDYIAYYAAKLAGASGNETDSTKLYGDINAINGIDQWLCLYYTKNKNVGKPITSQMIISSDGILKASEEGNFSFVHMFGSDSAANLNQFNSKKGAKSIYIFFANENVEPEQSGSLFSGNGVLPCLVMFIIGAGISAAVTYCVMRKKKLRNV